MAWESIGADGSADDVKAAVAGTAVILPVSFCDTFDTVIAAACRDVTGAVFSCRTVSGNPAVPFCVMSIAGFSPLRTE